MSRRTLLALVASVATSSPRGVSSFTASFLLTRRFAVSSRLRMASSTTSATDETLSEIALQYQTVLERVQSCASSAGTEVRLVAVSKTKPVEALQQAHAGGCRIFGENYVQELVDKVPVLPDDIHWHFIGALQSNKANLLVQSVPTVDRLTVETVGSLKLANKLEKAVADKVDAESDKKYLRVFVQVNTSGEDSKSGVSPGDECVELCRHIVTSCPHLQLAGLMTIGAPGDASCFGTLRECRKAVLALDVDDDMPPTLELSMGMSGDYEAAIAAGSTNVRVGSTIFGARDYSK